MEVMVVPTGAAGVELDASLRLCEDLVLRAENFGGLMFHRKLGQIFVLNKVGYEALSRCNGKLKVSEIIGEISQGYRKTSPEVISQGVTTFLTEALGARLVEKVAP
jgi:hypothetical protein